MIHGIDVSAYQPAAYDLDGLDFVFTKITEGLTYTNPLWVQQRERARKAGLVWGAYHYPHMGNDPRAEADRFLSKVAWQPGDLIALDWEGYDSANKNISHARQLAYRDAWLKYVQARMPGHRVGMYANTDYWKTVDRTSNCGDFLWIATAGRPAGSPGIEHPWVFHQYSTANNVDHDVANFPSRAALAAWAAGTTPEQEDDMQLTDVVKLASWVKHTWPKDKGLQDDITLTTAIGSGYAHARRADENSLKILAQLGAQSATIDKLVDAIGAGGGLTAAEVKAAAEAGAQAALAKLGDALTEG